MKKIFLIFIICLLLVGCGAEEPNLDGLDPKEQIETIVNTYVEEQVWGGEITDLQVNEDADGEGYVCLLWVDWDLQNTNDHARGVLQAYADELCFKLADNGNTSEFVVFFNAIQQGGLYKRTYTIENGEPTPTDEVCQF